MDAKNIAGVASKALEIFQALQDVQTALSPILQARTEPARPTIPNREPDTLDYSADGTLTKIYLPEVGTGTGESIWAFYLGNELYRLDNYPVNQGYKLGDLVRAVGGGPGRLPYVIARISQ